MTSRGIDGFYTDAEQVLIQIENYTIKSVRNNENSVREDVRLNTIRKAVSSYFRKMRRPSDEWCRFHKIPKQDIKEFDGWDTENLEDSWAEPITEHEFYHRLNESLIQDTTGNIIDFINEFRIDTE